MSAMVEYSSNNSGGRWWLKDEQWKALEDAGWYVVWGGWYFCNSSFSFREGKPEKAPAEPCQQEERNGRPWNLCHGHRMRESPDGVDRTHELGALATRAKKEFPTLADAIREWERITGMDASDEGCGCCGPPHNFSSKDEYASGDSVVGVLYGDDMPKSLREAAERLKASK